MAYLDAFEKPSAQPETKRTSYLDAFEKGANTAPKNLEPEHPYLDIAKDIGIKAAQGAVDLGQSAVGLGSLATRGLFGKGMRAIGYDPQTTNAMLGEHLSDQQKAADAAVANADGVGDTVSAALHNPRAIAGAIAESAPSMLGGMGVTRAAASGIAKRAGIGLGAAEAAQAGNAAVQQAAGKLATIGAATEGAQAAGTIADNAQAQGKDYTDYALPAVGAGLSTAAIGKVGSKLAGDIGTDIASGTHTVKGGYAARVAKAALTDSAEETSQSAQEQAFTNKAMGEQDLTKGVGNAAGMGAVTGGVMGGGMASTQVTPKPNSPLSNAAETAQANGATEQLTKPEQHLEEAAPNPLAEHLDNSANKNQWVAQSFNQAHDLKQQLAEQEGLRAKDFKVFPISNSDGSKQFIVQRVNQIVPQVNNQDASLPLQNEAQPQQTQPAEPSPTQHPPEQMQNRDRSGIYSVIQMQKIAKKPDYDRMGVGNSMDESAPMVSVKNDIQSIAPQHMGNEGVTTFPDGTKVPFRYAVVPADSVQTSHDASGNANHTYNDPQDGQLVALNNGRTAGLKQAYQQGTAQDYQSKLQQDTRHGIDPVTVENTPNPMLIKVYSDEANKQIPNIGAQSNSRPNLGLSTIEQAKTDAAALPDDAVWGVNHTDLTHASNQDFIRHTLSNMVPDNERSQLLDAGGQLTQQGLKRMQSALTMKAYDAPDIIKDNFEATDPEIKSIGNALTDVSPQVLQVKEAVKSGHVAPEWDIAPAIAKAAQIVRQAKAEDKPVMQLVANNQLDPADNVSPETKAVLGLMFKDGQYTKQASGKELATKLRQYTQSAIKSQNADIFGDNQTPAETLAKLSNIGEKNEATTVGTGTPENSLAYRSERNKWNGAEQTSPATQDQVQGSVQAVGNGANNKGEMNDHAIDKTREPDIHQEQPDIAAVERKNLSTTARFMQNAHTKQSLTKTIKQTMDNTYGKGWSSRLAETGKFKVIDRIQAEKIAGIKPSKKSVAQAFYMPSNKTTYLIADNIRQQDDIKALMLHEIGVHALTLGREDAAFKEILKQVESMKETNPKIKAAFGRVPTGTNPYHVAEEAVAYLVQDHPNLPVVQKLLAVFRKFVRKVGLSLGINERMKFFQWADKLNDTDLIHMASSALKSAPKRLSRDDMNATGSENLGIKLSAFPNQNQNIIPGTPTTEGLDRFPPVSNGRPPSQNSLPESQPAGQRSLPAETHAQRNQRLLQDSDNRFKVAQDYVKKNGGTVTEANDMYHAMERMPGRVAAQMEDFQRNTVDKLLQRMAKGNFEKNDVALYLYAIHAPERNAAIAKINPRFQDGGSGMMNQEADDTIKEIKSHYGGRFGEFKKVAEAFQGITDKTLDMLVSSGSISQGEAMAYRTAYSDYVPLKGFEKLDEGGKHGAGTGIGHSTNRNFSKRAL